MGDHSTTPAVTHNMTGSERLRDNFGNNDSSDNESDAAATAVDASDDESIKVVKTVDPRADLLIGRKPEVKTLPF